MPINFNLSLPSQGCQSSRCVDKFGCPHDRCPDFIIRRYDTKPEFKVALEDCDGPLDLDGLVVEVNMWAKGRLKASIADTDTYFALADGIGFQQIMIGDIILMDRVRMPEYMLVTGFDEDNQFVQVQRGYRSTTPSNWKKGTNLRIFRVMDSPAQTEIIMEDIKRPDGVMEKDTVTSASVVYEWQAADTCLPGCYWLEFKVIKMLAAVFYLSGGTWTGNTNTDDSGVYWTGTTKNDGSARLSYDSVNNQYLLTQDEWSGPYHLYSGSYYTGTDHTDSSVTLARSNATHVGHQHDQHHISSIAGPIYPNNPDYNYYDQPFSNDAWVDMVDAFSVPSCVPSIVPSFVDEDLTSQDFGCILGAGVEWIRRFPLSDEGFLIKIVDSFTREL